MSKVNRSNLNIQQKELLNKLIPLAQTISSWIYQKAEFLRIPIVKTLYPSIVLSDIIVQSGWNTHPVSQPFLNNKYSNNLSLIQIDELWEGKTHEFEGKVYKAYKDWIHYATDYSDIMIFNHSYKTVLLNDSMEDQLNHIANLKKDNLFASKASALIEFYELTQFN